MNVLFICSRNQWRSRTAEDLFKNDPVHRVRSAGTSEAARIRVNEKLIGWADCMVAMEKRHKQLLKERFPVAIKGKGIIVLGIPDEYGYIDEALVRLLMEHLC